MDVHRRWNEHLRREHKKPKTEEVCCQFCDAWIQLPESWPAKSAVVPTVFEQHLSAHHGPLLHEKATQTQKARRLVELWEAAAKSLRDGSRQSVSGPEQVSPSLQKMVGSTGEGVPINLRPSSQRRTAAGAGAVGPGPRPVTPEVREKSKSPTPSKRESSRSESPPKRSKAARPVTMEEGRADFERGSAYQKGKLWNPDDHTAAPRLRPFDKSNVANQRQRPSSGSRPHRPSNPTPTARATAPLPVADDSTDIVKQPETRPISQEQLVAEVKGIYAGLVMVESKCIEVDNNQSSQSDLTNKLNDDQWQALIALHRTLLHEHHDFFLASQHPSASPALRRLAAKYAMPARMWRHGIHSFLELLRHRLPTSLDHMLTFIYMAYSMVALLYETVPAFEDTWIECLGDLGRYRMAIEDDDIRDREVWTGVSRHWYSRASDNAPTTGRLYHHLAILARPSPTQQLYYYSKSLCVEMPFLSARESIMTLFEPIMSRTPNPQQAKLPPTDLSYVKSHGILFSGRQQEDFELTMATFLQLLDNHIGRSVRRWLESGYHIGISNACSVMGYGNETNPITIAFKAASRLRPGTNSTNISSDSHAQDQASQDTSTETSAGPHDATATKLPPNTKQLPNALRLFAGTYNVVCRRFGDPNILPFLHVSLVFMHHLTLCPDAMAHVAPHFPWKLTAVMLNTLLESSLFSSTAPSLSVLPLPSASASASASQKVLASQNVPVQTQDLARLLEEKALFPGSSVVVGGSGESADGAEKEGPSARRSRPLPDDFALRGFPWSESYFPDGWFATEEKIDDDDKYFEVPSMMEERKSRVVWLGCRIAESGAGKWLRLEKAEGGRKRFAVSPEFEVDLDLDMAGQMPPTPGESVEYGELPDAGTGPWAPEKLKSLGKAGA